MTSRLPRFAAWLLGRRLPGEWREFILGDLEEEFARRRRTSPSAARRWIWWQTLRCLAAPPSASESFQHARPQGDSMLRTAAADVRYAVRVLFRAPSFALAVVAILALGIGANTAIFSIVNTVLLKPMPFRDSDRLVRLFHVPPQDAFPGMPTFSVSAANFYDWQRDAKLFDGMAIYRFRQFTLVGGGSAESVVAAAVGSGFFDIVGTPPALGRVFRPDEDAPGRGHVVVLSDGFWKSHFGAAPDVIGRTMTLDGQAFTIVGVMPPGFTVNAWGATGRPLWVPLAYTNEQKAVRDNHNDQVIARLGPGVTVAQARAEMEAISRRLEQEYPRENAGWGATVIPLHELIVGDVRLSLVMLLAAVGLVLLIACANVGNLFFARALARRKELAIRSALGAGRGRVFQQLLIEAVVLALAGGALGLGLAHYGLQAGAAYLADQLPRADEVTIDGRVLWFVFGISLLTAVLAGAWPALRAGRTDLTEALKEGGRAESAVGVRTRRLLIASEIALSLVLLMAAGVMFRTLVALRTVDAGYDPRSVLTMRVSLPEARYETPGRVRAFFDEAVQRLRSVPGVTDAGAIDDLPSQGGSVQPIVLEGRPELLPRDQPTVQVRAVTPGYIEALRIPLLRGRDVTDADGEVMLVSRSAAKLMWGDQDPIGRRVTLPLESRTRLIQVVGIVGDVKQDELSGDARPTVYQTARENARRTMAFTLRTAVPPASVAPAATSILRSLDPNQPIEDVKSMETVLDETLTAQRFSALLLAMFATVALVLASVGIYSVLSYIVRGRRREIGIRAALGARRADVLRLVVAEGMTPTLVGIGAGIAAALAAGRILERLVFGVSAYDPLTLAVVAGTMVGVSLAASLVPAWRASRLDPLAVLRTN